MSQPNPSLADYKAILARHGWRYMRHRVGKHLCIHAERKGRTALFVASISPGDRRELLNFECYVRRAGRMG